MKLNKWLYGVTALAMLAACSDKDVAPGGYEEDNGNSPAQSVKGYLAVEIKLPEEPSTRGAEDESNDYFQDGTSNEYEVKNAMIAIFKGATERNATFVKAQALKKPFFASPSDGNITSSYLAAIQIDTELTGDESFWAWVILNSNLVPDKGDSDYENTTDKASFKIGDVTVSKTTKFSDIIATAKVDDSSGSDSFVTGSGTTASKFFMTNAPLSTVAGDESVDKDKIFYLTNLGSTVYPTIEQAKAATDRPCVYVERAVAKLTCSKLTDDKLKLKFYDGDGNQINTNNWTIKVNTFNYALTNTPYESYVVRNVEFAENDNHFKWNFKNNNKYRFVGNAKMQGLENPFHTSQKNYYRTYWCMDPNYDSDIDPNYDSDIDAGKKKIIKNASELVSTDLPLYCKENTFDVAHQNYKNTNIAIFELDLTITDDKGNTYTDLYVKDGNTAKIYVTKEAAYADGITRILINGDIQEALIEAAKAASKTPIANESGKITIKNIGNYLDYSWDEESDELSITKIKLNTAATDFETYFDATTSVAKFNDILGSETDSSSKHYKLLQDINAISDVLRYAGGKSYYYIPVMHFGKHYCPWGADEGQADITGTTTIDVYNEGKAEWDDAHAKKYLGRYGMVRNNWYELNISKIEGLGEQHIPDVDIEMSDDNKVKKQYFALEIHVLSWAKRTQEVKF